MDVLDKRDYVEPRCLLCEDPYGADPKVIPVPQRRIVEKVDEYMSRRDYAGVERHLKYWLEEAKLGHDLKGELMIRNELIGHYRKTGEKEKAFAEAEAALRLPEAIGYDGAISEGTVYVNIATMYSAFGENARAAELFDRARAIYESAPNIDPSLLGGLYNNTALVYTALGRYPEAYAMFDKALAAMKKVPNGELERAITHLNIADLWVAEHGEEDSCNEVEAYLDEALSLLDTPTVPRDGYYAFVCEKCAPIYAYYGYFLEADDLNERARRIYERA